MENKRKVMTGIVVSDRMEKTVVVKVGRIIRHPKYLKTLRISKKYKAHDEKNECSLGDRVKIFETRPLSCDKRWRLLEIVEKGKN